MQHKRYTLVITKTRRNEYLKIIDFINKTEMASKSEVERAKLICFYAYKENHEMQFSMTRISDLLVMGGFNAPNQTRLKNNLVKGKNKSFIKSKTDSSMFEFIPAVFQSIENELEYLWGDTDTIKSESELLDENKFCKKRNFLDRIILQINHSYANNCYDATAVLMRRLFEVLLVLTYQNLGIDDEIKDTSGNGYLMLEAIVNNAKSNKILKLSRIKNEFDDFRKVGNFSAHSITYTAGKKDIDDIKLNYRVMLEELYNKAGLML